MKFNKFILSAITDKNKFIETGSIIDWIQSRLKSKNINVQKVKFQDLSEWDFTDNSSLRHRSGKFFSIEGLNVISNLDYKPEWKQPIIHQPEIGILGFIVKEFDGILHFLVQAKVEPGNINNIQLSPTIQATKSNYTQVHKGLTPKYLEYFLNNSNTEFIFDQLQSEHGSRFYRKRNRNVIIKVEGDIPVYDDFIWLTLGQIKKMMMLDNVVNMNSRTVISCIPMDFAELLPQEEKYLSTQFPGQEFIRGMIKSARFDSYTLHTIDDIIRWFTGVKSFYDLQTKFIPLNELDEWSITEESIHHKRNRYFHVLPVKVEIEGREVVSWTQPLIQPDYEGLTAFIVKEINGVYHFIVQAKLECGNLDIVELGPTVQINTGRLTENDYKEIPFLEYVQKAPEHQIKIDTKQSEEGGRFYREQNRNLFILADEDFSLELPRNYVWMTLNQMSYFLKYNNYLNIQARSLLSIINFI